MTGFVIERMASGLTAWVWSYLADNWIGIAVYLIVAAIVCAAVRKSLAVYGLLPMIAGVVILVVGAWTLGYRSAPVKIEVREVVRTVVKPIPDTTGIDNLRKRLDEMTARRDAVEAARRAAISDLAQVRQDLAAMQAEIKKLLAALAAKPTVEKRVPDANGQCPYCGHLMNIGEHMRQEQVRCRNCGSIFSVKRAWARRAYVRNRTE